MHSYSLKKCKKIILKIYHGCR